MEELIAALLACLGAEEVVVTVGPKSYRVDYVTQDNGTAVIVTVPDWAAPPTISAR